MLNFDTSYIMSKKNYLIVYFIFIIVFSASFFSLRNYTSFNFELIILLILLVTGFFIILYYSDVELHKSCFVIILIFGLLMTFTTPILVVCDETEHFARSDLIAQGSIAPEYVDNGYKVSHLLIDLTNHSGETFFNNNLANEKIDSSVSFYPSCFAHNPFFAYLLSAFGIFLAKLFNLPALWAMWLGRLFNLLFYAVVCSYSVKKAPAFKTPLFIVSCVPLAIYQAASFSADCFIIAVSIFSIAQFIYLYKSPKVTPKDLGIFFISVLFVSFFKFPYILLSFFVFLVKKDQFASKNIYLLSRIIPFILIGICLAYTSYASNILLNSARRDLFISNNVNSTAQLNYMLNHPFNTLLLFSSIFSFTVDLIFDLFRFSHATWTYESPLLSVLYFVFFALFSFTYSDRDIEFKCKSKLFITLISLLMYVGIIFAVYLSWASVGYGRLDMVVGIYARYFIPLLAILPIIFSSTRLSSVVKIDNINSKLILMVLIFLAGTIILTVSKFY